MLAAGRRTVGAATSGAGRAGRAVAARGSKAVEATAEQAARTRETLASLPEPAKVELKAAVGELYKVRSAREIPGVLETQVEHLLRVVTPILVQHPLPAARSVAKARLIVAGAAGAAATMETLSAMATVGTAGAASPSIAASAGGLLAAFVVELYTAVSVRVWHLRDAGRHVDPHEVARDVAAVLAGTRGGPLDAVGQRIARRVVTRLAARWGSGVAPVAGAAYSGWDAQRTIAAIRRLPLPPPQPPTGREHAIDARYAHLPPPPPAALPPGGVRAAGTDGTPEPPPAFGPPPT